MILYECGLFGYLDVDVLLYVIIDVLFGVVVFGDIGCYFFDMDVVFKGVDSCVLLCVCVECVKVVGFMI